MPLDVLHDLNDQQRAIVGHGQGPCLVLAGAGSGKTRTITCRVAHLIAQGVKPSEILLLTFTNKAAREMMERAHALVGSPAGALMGGTFHHIANVFLRRAASSLGFTSSFTILDEDDRRKLIRETIKTYGAPPMDLKGDVVGALLSLAANRAVDVEELVQERFPHGRGLSHWFSSFGQVLKERKRTLNAMDFDDLLLYWLELLRGNDALSQQWKRRFRHVLVDEYQDVNQIQEEIIRSLTEVHRNVVAVGDDAQSIYGFRGAQVEHIRAFPRVYHPASVYRLESNYRSSPEIIALANAALVFHSTPFQKTLRSERPPGVTPQLLQPFTLEEEAQAVVRIIEDARAAHKPFASIAVLFRSTAQALQTELALQQAEIPYELRGGLRFFEQAHIKDMVAVAKILALWNDELSWRRVVQLFEGLGPTASEHVWKLAQGSTREQFALSLTTLPKIAARLMVLTDLFGQAPQTLADALLWWLKHWYNQYLEATFDDAQARLDDCEALVSYVAHYDSIDELFASIALSERFSKDRQARTNEDRVILSTIHQAKGLEWDTVVILGLTDGAFPHFRSFDNPKELEEERRLFYVAVTRAKDELILSCPQESGGGSLAIPSRFVLEVKEALAAPEDEEEATIQLKAPSMGGILDRVMAIERGKREGRGRL